MLTSAMSRNSQVMTSVYLVPTLASPSVNKKTEERAAEVHEDAHELGAEACWIAFKASIRPSLKFVEPLAFMLFTLSRMLRLLALVRGTKPSVSILCKTHSVSKLQTTIVHVCVWFGNSPCSVAELN
jgi:hypothetical protein